MKKILKVLGILAIFFIAITIFVAIDFTIMVNGHDNDIAHECSQVCGLGIAFFPIVSTWKFALIMIIVGIIVKFYKKLDSVTKTTIYLLPILSFYGFFYATMPALWLMKLLGL